MKTSWYLDTGALPDHLWARLRVHSDGPCEIVDADGQSYWFPDLVAASDWLQHDDYALLADLGAPEEGAAAVRPPAEWPPPTRGQDAGGDSADDEA